MIIQYSSWQHALKHKNFEIILCQIMVNERMSGLCVIDRDLS